MTLGLTVINNCTGIINTQHFRKTNNSHPLIRARMCAYQGLTHVSFLENFAYVLYKWPHKIWTILRSHDDDAETVAARRIFSCQYLLIKIWKIFSWSNLICYNFSEQVFFFSFVTTFLLHEQVLTWTSAAIFAPGGCSNDYGEPVDRKLP